MDIAHFFHHTCPVIIPYLTCELLMMSCCISHSLVCLSCALNCSVQWSRMILHIFSDVMNIMYNVIIIYILINYQISSYV